MRMRLFSILRTVLRLLIARLFTCVRFDVLLRLTIRIVVLNCLRSWLRRVRLIICLMVKILKMNYLTLNLILGMI